jgi:hypothetical protein
LAKRISANDEVRTTELIIVGGDSHLVLYKWNEGCLQEFFAVKLKNIIEIRAFENWFAVKYKKDRVKLFHLVIDDFDFERAGCYDLKIKPFKSEYRTLAINRFRKQQLIIFDTSKESKGYDIQVELFDTKLKKSVALEDFDVEGKSPITCIVYNWYYRKLLLFDREKFFIRLDFDPEVTDRNKSGIRSLNRRPFESKGYATRAIINSFGNYFVVATSNGEIYFIEGNKLKSEYQVISKNYAVLDFFMGFQANIAIIVSVSENCKEFSKYHLKGSIGNYFKDTTKRLKPMTEKGIFKIFF